MYNAQVVSFWDNRTLDAGKFLLAGESCCDATGQQSEHINPDPNMLVVEMRCSEATLAAIEAHPDYGPEAILTSEEIVDETI